MTPGSDSNPFVGLRPFESDESLLFFGRQEQSLELLQRLNRHHFVAVTGGSGSGKSSIIKAGLIPRLKAGYLVNDSDRWVISVMKPGQSPLCNLADSVLSQLDPSTHDLTATGVQEKIAAAGVDALLDILKRWNNDTNFFLLIDQFEELFRFSTDEKDIIKKDEATDFVNILLALSNQTEFPVYIVMTMRSDFIGDCAQFYGLPEAMNQSQYIVPRLNRIQLETTIEGPVRLYDGKINPALTARLLNDAQLVKDELPLLQHVMMRIWDREKHSGINGELDLDDYENIGGIEKALSNHADEALTGMLPEELNITKKMFQALTGIDENGRKIRRPVRMSELKAITGAGEDTLLALINRFIEGNRSFLVINKSGDTSDLLIDISHESLIRQWGTLNGWVDEEAESGKMYKRLSEAAALYNQKEKDLLTGNELQQSLQWFHAANPGKAWAQRYNPDYDGNIRYLEQSEAEAKNQRSKKLRNRRLLLTALFFVILIISGFAFLLYRNYISNKKELALNYWRNAQATKPQNNLLDGLHLIAEAGITSNDDELNQKLLIDGEAYLPQTSLKNILPQNDVIYHAVFSPDNNHILIAGNDGKARIIDKITGKQVGIDMRHQSPVNTAVFSPDGKWILTAGNDHTARIWDAVSGQQLYIFQHDDDLASAVFSPDGKMVLTASAGFVDLWEIATEKKLDSFKYVFDVSSAIFSPDGTKILITANDVIPHLLDLRQKKELHFLDTSKDGASVYRAIFSHDGKKILTINSNSIIDIWDTAGKHLSSLVHPARINDAVFSPDDKMILSASDDKTARLWDITTQMQSGASMKHEGPVYAVDFSADGKQVITGSADKTIRLWDIAAAFENSKVVCKHSGTLLSAFFNKEGTKILTTGNDAMARLWDLAGNQTDSFKNNTTSKNAFFNPDGTKILSIGFDSTVSIWNISDHKPIISLKVKNEPNCAAFSADGKLLITATAFDNAIYTWNIAGDSPARLIDSFRYVADIISIAFSIDGKNILIASEDSAAHILDATSGKLLKSFKHDDIVTSAAFSPDGKNVLTVSWDKTVRLWDIATEKRVGPPMKNSANTFTAVFSPDGKWIITAGADSAVHLWDRNTLKEVGVPRRQPEAVSGAVFSPDGKWILTSGYDGTARLWQVDGDLDMSPSLFKLQAQAITGVEYYSETGETNSIEPAKWLSLKQEYDTQGRDHYKVCKYPRHNLWCRFNKEEGMKIRPDEGSGK